MRLRALELAQFRKFDQPIRVTGFSDGLNLIAGPNELGKSTLLAALRAVLFERHRANTDAVRSLAPIGLDGAAPFVALEFELDGGRHRIEKRFLRRPAAVLHLPGGERLENDPAEDALLRLLHAGPPGRRRVDGEQMGVWSLLWVGQGGSLEPPEVGPGARGTLQALLDVEIGEVLAGSHGPALRAAVEGALSQLVDRRPTTPKPKGRFREVAEALATLDAEIAPLERAVAELADDLARLGEEQQAERRLRAEADAGAEEAELRARRQQRDELLRREAALAKAGAARDAIRRELDTLQHALGEAGALAAAEAWRAESEAALVGAREALADASRAVAEGAARAEALVHEQTQIEHRRQGLRDLALAERERARCQTALRAMATEVRLALQPEALARVRIDGRPVPAARHDVPAIDPVEIAIEGVGRIRVQPRIEAAAELRVGLDQAERRITELTEALGGSPPTSARPPPQGQLDMFAAGARPAGGPGGPDDPLRAIEQAAGEIRARIAEQRADLAAADAVRRVAETDLLRAQTGQDRAAAEIAERRTRLDRLRQQLAPDVVLDAEVVAERETALAAAEAEVARLHLEAAPSLAQLDQRIEQIERGLEERRRGLGELAARIRERQTRIAIHAGEGPGERLEQARGLRRQLAREHAKHAREVRVLELLGRVLREAEDDARKRHLEPLLERIQRHLRVLFPAAELALDPDFRVTAMTRKTAETLVQLSAGTREQIAVVTRLAFAELLAERGRPAVVVLDDALVHADDRRIGQMFEILGRAAERVQIVVLTCREQLFAALPAERLQIDQVAEGGAKGAA